jgi:hypothetical protein
MRKANEHRVRLVRDRVRQVWRCLLAGRSEHAPAGVLATTLVVRSRVRGGFAYAQTLAALVNAPRSLRDGLLASGDTASGGIRHETISLGGRGEVALAVAHGGQGESDGGCCGGIRLRSRRDARRWLL